MTANSSVVDRRYEEAANAATTKPRNGFRAGRGPPLADTSGQVWMIHIEPVMMATPETMWAMVFEKAKNRCGLRMFPCPVRRRTKS